MSGIRERATEATEIESEIRNTLRQEGFIDTKVASVSTTLTALRFIKRT